MGYFTYSDLKLYIIKPHNKKKATVGNGTMVTFLAKSNKEVNDFKNFEFEIIN